MTGLGLVTPLGAGVEATWAGLVRGDRAIGPVRLFDAGGQRAGLVAEVQGDVLSGVRELGYGHRAGSGAAAWSRTSAMAASCGGGGHAAPRRSTCGRLAWAW